MERRYDNGKGIETQFQRKPEKAVRRLQTGKHECVYLRREPEEIQKEGKREMNYLEFLKTKIEIAEDTGFEAPPHSVNTGLKPHQRDAVMWALRGGRRAQDSAPGI